MKDAYTPEEIREMQKRIKALEKVVNDSLRYFADLNGSAWIKGEGAGEMDMRQRAKSIQSKLYKLSVKP